MSETSFIQQSFPRTLSELSLTDIEGLSEEPLPALSHYQTLEGRKEMEVASGVVQGATLGPDLWDASYYSPLELDMPEDLRLVSYADDVAALAAERTLKQAQCRFGILIRLVKEFMTAHDFNLTLKKPEVVILTKKRIPTLSPILVGESIIGSKPKVKYLGLTIGSKMSFSEQIKAAANKTAAGISTLSRLMANIEGPTSSKRCLLMSSSQSVRLYGAEVWADALGKEVYRKPLAHVQRRADFRVASDPAVMVIVEVIPIALLAEERKAIYI